MGIKMKIKPNNIEWTKTMKRFCWTLIMIFSVLATDAFSKDWNGIVPCVSTRLEAEKILGKDRTPTNIGIYRYKIFRVHIEYEKNKNDPNKYVVEKIKVYPDKTETLAKYIRKIPNFHKDFIKTEVDNKISHVNGLAYYRNWIQGFEIIVQKNEKDEEIIAGFVYFAANLSAKSSSWCD